VTLQALKYKDQLKSLLLWENVINFTLDRQLNFKYFFFFEKFPFTTELQILNKTTKKNWQ
jgi:hypothetical protein